MKILMTLFVFFFMAISLYSQREENRDTVYTDVYTLPRVLKPNDLTGEIIRFLEENKYDIIEDSAFETDGRQDNFKKNNANWFARNILGRKDLKEYSFIIRHSLTFSQTKKGRNYVSIYSLAELESKSLSEDIIQDIQKDAMDSARKIAKKEFDQLKDRVKKKAKDSDVSNN